MRHVTFGGMMSGVALACLAATGVIAAPAATPEIVAAATPASPPLPGTSTAPALPKASATATKIHHYRHHHRYRHHFVHHRVHHVVAAKKRSDNPVRTWPNDSKEVALANRNTVYIISGRLISSYLRMMAEVGAVVDEGNKMRAVPMIGKGTLQNVSDVLYLKGIDLGIFRLDSLNYLKKNNIIPDLDKRIVYICPFTNDEMHILVPDSITDIHQLEGKKVNIDIAGSGTNFSASLVFKRLGIHIVPTTYYEKVAFVKLHQGEISGDVSFGAAPLAGLRAFNNENHHFHLIGVPYSDKISDTYLPATLTAKQYPGLVDPGKPVSTIAAPTMIGAYNWPEGSQRYERIARFVNVFFTNFKELQHPPRHPKWRDINIAATIPGWTRFKPAQEWIDKATAAASDKAAQKAN
ncbi:MAG: transporter [Hyphomicrobiales bacterium]|nr:transporter [Hyphomicrobiales bacterium]